MYGPFAHVEYDAFIFKVDSMHESLNEEEFQFQSDIFEHADPNFHNEQVVESKASFCMHYEGEGVDFIFPTGVFQDVNLIGKTDMNNISSLPPSHSNENQIYDIGKSFC